MENQNNNPEQNATLPESSVNTSKEPAKEKSKRNTIFPIIIGALIIGGGIYGYNKYQHGKYHEETDDAQISSNISPVISKISGYIEEVRVKDNQFVHKGDTLILLQNKDQKMALQQAEAALSTAKSNVSSARAGANAARKSINTTMAATATADAQIEAAKISVWRTSEDLKRYENLIKDHSITQQQYEQALAAKQTADKQLQVLVQQRNQANSQTGAVSAQSGASAEQIGVANSLANQRAVDVENAKLNLSYTVITAPADGFVGKVPVQNGQFLQAGSQLFTIVTNGEKWVIANFKETQVARMSEGQKVEISIDAFPKQKFEGVVSSLSPATGSTYSILPPDNASGNFVKVVQRVPVRIEFTDKNPDLIKKLRAGMNAQVEVTLN